MKVSACNVGVSACNVTLWACNGEVPACNFAVSSCNDGYPCKAVEVFYTRTLKDYFLNCVVKVIMELWLYLGWINDHIWYLVMFILDRSIEKEHIILKITRVSLACMYELIIKIIIIHHQITFNIKIPAIFYHFYMIINVRPKLRLKKSNMKWLCWTIN